MGLNQMIVGCLIRRAVFLYRACVCWSHARAPASCLSFQSPFPALFMQTHATPVLSVIDRRQLHANPRARTPHGVICDSLDNFYAIRGGAPPGKTDSLSIHGTDTCARTRNSEKGRGRFWKSQRRESIKVLFKVRGHIS